MTEMVICGASLLDGICSGELPPEQWRQTVNEIFVDDGTEYRWLPRVLRAGSDDEEDLREDGTWRSLPKTMMFGEFTVRGAVICNACYVTLCILSPSGAGLTHELGTALAKARSMDPAALPRIR